MCSTPEAVHHQPVASSAIVISFLCHERQHSQTGADRSHFNPNGHCAKAAGSPTGTSFRASAANMKLKCVNGPSAGSLTVDSNIYQDTVGRNPHTLLVHPTLSADKGRQNHFTHARMLTAANRRRLSYELPSNTIVYKNMFLVRTQKADIIRPSSALN